MQRKLQVQGNLFDGVVELVQQGHFNNPCNAGSLLHKLGSTDRARIDEILRQLSTRGMLRAVSGKPGMYIVANKSADVRRTASSIPDLHWQPADQKRPARLPPIPLNEKKVASWMHGTMSGVRTPNSCARVRTGIVTDLLRAIVDGTFNRPRSRKEAHGLSRPGASRGDVHEILFALSKPEYGSLITIHGKSGSERMTYVANTDAASTAREHTLLRRFLEG